MVWGNVGGGYGASRDIVYCSILRYIVFIVPVCPVLSFFVRVAL